MTVGQRIRTHYLNEGLSRRGFADQIGVAEQSVRRLEDGEGVHPSTAKKVADALGATVVELLPEPDREAAA
jgi:transcriptional regulator with XRE-family HTH domain